MEIKQVNPKELKPAEYNPRQMSEKQAKDLMESVKRFGLVDPLIVNSNKTRYNVVIGGHQRLRIALEQGFETVPVVYIDLDLESEQELNLRLNKNLGDWDTNLLANFNEDLLKDVGFDDLDKLFGLDGDDEEKCECDICGKKHKKKQ